MRIIILYILIVVTLLGCKKNSESIIIKPKACFTASNQIYTLNDRVILTNCSELSSKQHWIFDNEASSDDINPEYLFKIPGNKIIKLVCSNESGGKDSTELTVTILNEKYINIDEADNIRVFPVAMKIIGDGIYVVSAKYNIDKTMSFDGVLEKYDFQFNKKWEKSLGSSYGSAPKGDMVVTSNNQLIILVRYPNNAAYQYIHLMDTTGNIIKTQELHNYQINGVIEQNDKFIFCGNYLTGYRNPCIFQTDKNLNSIGNIYYNKLGSNSIFLDIINNGNLVVLGQKRDSDANTGTGNYFLYFLNNNLDSLSFYKIPVDYSFLLDNCAKLKNIQNSLYIYDFTTIYSYDINNKIINSKKIGDGFIRAFDLFENQFILFDNEKTFTYDLNFNLISERSNPGFMYHSDYFIDIEKFSDNKYLLLGSYDDDTNTFLGYAEHLRFFIYGKN